MTPKSQITSGELCLVNLSVVTHDLLCFQLADLIHGLGIQSARQESCPVCSKSRVTTDGSLWSSFVSVLMDCFFALGTHSNKSVANCWQGHSWWARVPEGPYFPEESLILIMGP